MLKLRRLIVLTIVGFPLLSIAQKDKAEERKNAYKNHQDIAVLQEQLKNHDARLTAEETQLKSLQQTFGNLDSKDFRDMQEKVQKHDIYLTIIGAVTGILVTALIGEIIRRAGTKPAA